MRTIILVALLFPLVLTAQKTDVYLKLIDASNQQIKGDATAKGHERSIGVLSFTSSGKNNTQLSFTMSISATSADIKRVMGNNSVLQSGMLTVTQANPAGGMPVVAYTIKMENIKVNSCAEMMGCNGIITTTTVLTATRIGWTYYQTDLKTGGQSVSRKYGFDSDSGREWTNF